MCAGVKQVLYPQFPQLERDGGKTDKQVAQTDTIDTKIIDETYILHFKH